MHQSGHERAHSMQAVQFSSCNAITPRARIGGDSFSLGYCTVAAPSVTVRTSVPNVTPSPLTRPGTLGMRDQLLGHQATFTMAVTAMLARDRGISTFHANAWGWSSRKRG